MEDLRLTQNDLEVLAQTLDLSLDSNSMVISGCYNHYKLFLFNQAGYAFVLIFTLSRSGMKPQQEILEMVMQENQAIGECVVHNYQVTYKIHEHIATGDLALNLKKLLNKLTNFFEKNHLETSCYLCGGSDNTDFIINANGAAMTLCASCSTQPFDSTFVGIELNEVKENWLLGTIGAFLGSLAGVAAQIMIGLLGFVSGISGIIMAVCSLKRYERLGKKISIKGIIVVGIVMLVMVFVGCMLNLSIELKDAFYGEVSTFEIFTKLFSLMDQVPELKRTFYENLLLTYIFTFIGAVPTIRREITERNKAVMNNRHKLNS